MALGISGLVFRVWGLGFGVWGLGCSLGFGGLGLGVWGFWVWGSGSGFQDLGPEDGRSKMWHSGPSDKWLYAENVMKQRGEGLGSMGFGFRVEGLRSRVLRLTFRDLSVPFSADSGSPRLVRATGALELKGRPPLFPAERKTPPSPPVSMQVGLHPTPKPSALNPKNPKP